MSVRGLQVPFDRLQRSHVPWRLRQFTRAVDSRVRPQFLIKGKPQTGLWTHGASIPCVVGNAFSKPLQAIPKPDLSTFVLDLMIYLMSYELCLMTYLMSYVTLSSHDLTALVYVLLLGLRLTISRNKYELAAREYTGINALFHSNDPKVHLGHVARSKPMSR